MYIIIIGGETVGTRFFGIVRRQYQLKVRYSCWLNLSMVRYSFHASQSNSKPQGFVLIQLFVHYIDHMMSRSNCFI
jgi:hypothetical protein